MSAAQQSDLLAGMKLGRRERRTVLEQVARSDTPIGKLADNPLFLSLLCQHLMRSDTTLPETPFELFESHVRRQMTLAESFLRIEDPSSTDTLAGAEAIAYAMSKDPTLGLSLLGTDSPKRARVLGILTVDATLSAISTLEYVN